MRKIIYRIGFRAWRLYCRLRKPVTLGSRVLVVRDQAVLLVRLTYCAGWFLPGGGVDRGETFESAAIREAKEECGIEVKNIKFLGVCLNRHEGNIDHIGVFAATEFTGEPHAADAHEIEEVRFFPMSSLPENLWAGHRRRIVEYRDSKTTSKDW